jgi:LysM repeat protein
MTWVNNPSQCSYSCERTIIKHKYPELNGAELEDLNPEAAVITGEGELFGPNAYSDWKKMVSIFNQHGVGEFFHPVYSDVTHALWKKLEARMEPRENYVSYTFEFWQHLPVKVASTTAKKTTSGSAVTGVLGTLNTGNTGDWVVKLQKALLADGEKLPKYGADGTYGSETESAVRKYQAKHKIGITGVAGPETLAHIGMKYYSGASSNTDKNSKLSKTYVVKSGDTLSKIASKYNTTWQALAKKNNIKNPHSIKPGNKIMIS